MMHRDSVEDMAPSLDAALLVTPCEMRDDDSQARVNPVVDAAT
jgi:hypothetical protein